LPEVIFDEANSAHEFSGEPRAASSSACLAAGLSDVTSQAKAQSYSGFIACDK
jgi:hypothetical protein